MDNQPPEKKPRKGRARERQRRRKERGQQETRNMLSRSGARQLVPSGGFKMPEIKIPQQARLLLLAVVGIAFVAVVILALGVWQDDEPKLDPNAIWLGTEWTYEQPSNEDVLALSQRLRDNRIGTVYAYISWLKVDLTWAGIRTETNSFTDVEQYVTRFVQQFRLVYPEAVLYAWVSVPTNTLGIPARLDITDLQRTVSAFCARMIEEFGFDGVHLDIEQVWDGDEDYLQVLRMVRARLGIETPISVAMTPDWSPEDVDFPVPAGIAPGTFWSKEYKQSVALLTDQIAVMAFNSGLNNEGNNTPTHYSQWMAYQVVAFSEAVAELNTDTQIVIGIPTYDDELPGHDTQVETIPAAIQGVRMGLEQAGESADIVQGIALYAEWTTDDSEWTLFKSNWIGD